MRVVEPRPVVHTYVCEFRPVRACSEGWKEFCFHEIWMGFKERQCVAELGMTIGILYLARW